MMRDHIQKPSSHRNLMFKIVVLYSGMTELKLCEQLAIWGLLRDPGLRKLRDVE